MRVGWTSVHEKHRKCSSSRAWAMGSRVSSLYFVRRKIQEWVLSNLPHHHLLVKLHLLIQRSLRDPKNWAWISHPKPSTRANTPAKEDLIRASSGWSVEIGRSMQLLDISKSFIPCLPAVEIIDPCKGDEFETLPT